MFQLDEKFLVSLGLGGMPADEKEAFLEYVYQELELRVGTELSKKLSDEQLEEFQKLIASDQQTEAVTWLNQYCPNYREVVARQLEKLKEEIISSRDQLLDAAT